jgi:hypothetical protein
MERAFQRQVIYGGSLDTILLEMNLVPEDRLIQYLSLATGLPPATSAETAKIDGAAAKKCPLEQARLYRVAPLSFDGDALRVLVHDPVDMSALEDLANQLGAAVQPLVVPEYRYHLAFQAAFGTAPEPRYVKLAEMTMQSPRVAPVGKTTSVIVEDSAPVRPTSVQNSTVSVSPSHPVPAKPRTAAPVAAPTPTPDETGTAESSPPVGAAALDGYREADTSAITVRAQGTDSGNSGNNGETETLAGTDRPPDVRPSRATTVVFAPPPPVASATGPTRASTEDRVGENRREQARTQAGTTSSVGAAERTPEVREQRSAATTQTAGLAADLRQPEPMVTSDCTPLSLQAARSGIAEARTRDEIFQFLLRGLAAQADYSALLSVQGEMAVGRIAIDTGRFDNARISTVKIQIHTSSVLHHAVTSASPYIGKLSSGNAATDDMLCRLGGVLPPSALILPLAVRDRVLALAIAHSKTLALDPVEVSRLLPLGAAVTEALTRLIVRGKKTPGDPGSSPTSSNGRSSSPPASANSTSSQAQGEAGPTQEGSPATAEQLLDRIEQRDNPEDWELAVSAVLRRADDVMSAIAHRFPGRLRVRRSELSGRILPATEHGPLLALLVRMGAPATPFLISQLRHQQAEIRYYAALCLAEQRPATPLPEWADRLADPDAGVRAYAIAVLQGYSVSDREVVLDLARAHLLDREPIKAALMAESLAALADVKAISPLLDLLALQGESAASARVALISLTKQDFALQVRRWRAWYAKNKGRTRIEWLLDALGHKDAELRRSAAEELHYITGEYFGYHHDLPKRERTEAQQRWIQWWMDTGRRQYLRGGDSFHPGGTH